MRFLFIIGLAALAACCPPVHAQTADSLHAVVSDRPITQQQIENYVGGLGLERQLEEHYASQPDVYRKKMNELWMTGLETLISRQVILHDFKESIKVPESIIEDIVTEEIKADNPDRIALVKKLELQGTTMDQLRKEYRERFIVGQMHLKFVPDPLISPLKIENYYVAHRDSFKLEDQVKLRMIFMKRGTDDTTGQVRKRAEEIHTQIKGGASFEQLARVYSEGSLQSEGGETGWEDFSVVNKILVPEINKLKPGQSSDVIEAPEGFYLLLLEDRHPSHYRPLSEVRDEVEKTLANQERQRLSDLWINRLRKKTFIKYF